MKRFLKIFLIVFVLIFALLLIIPVAFKGKILEIARTEINRNLNAKVEFTDLRLSLIRNFPNLCVSLNGLSVVGIDDFESDTLVSFKTFRTVVDIKSAIWGDAIEVRSILLDEPRVKARVLADGRANWDIMIVEEDPDVYQEAPGDPGESVPGDEEGLEAETETGHEPDEPGDAAVKVSLRSFEIRNGRIEYDDVPLDMRTTLGGFNMAMKGDLTEDFTSLDISASSDIFNFWFDGIRYITNARLSLITLLDADMNDFRFTIKDNEILLNELAIGMEGFVAMPESDIDMDISFFSKKTDFRTILSLVPAIFMTDFEGLTASGSLSLEGFARGSITDQTMPSVGLDLVMENAGFSYPDLPESLDNLNMNLSIFYDGVDEDQTTVDLHSFNMEMAGNPFDMGMSIRTPMSDMFVDAFFAGNIDFTSLADIIPLEDITIRGLLESELSFAGHMSDIEEERYEYFNAQGSIQLTAFRYSDPGFPQDVSIPRAVMDFSPRYVELTDFESQIGNSDFRMSGRLENFIPYIFNDGTVRGNMLFFSRMLDLNEFLAGETDEEAADTVPLSVVEVPGNIDFVLASSIDSILFDDMEISHLRGRIIVRDSKVMMEGVRMNMLEGSIAVNGEYNTMDMNAPFIDFAMDINDFDIPSSFHTFNTVQQLTPIAGDLRGRFSTSMAFNALLDDEMMPVMNSIDAAGRLSTTSVELVSSTTFDRLSQVLSLREDKSNVLRDLDIRFTVKDGRVSVEPFDASMGPVNMVIGGDQGIDRTMNYLIKMTIPRSEFGSGANQVINNLAESAAARGFDIQPGENVNVDARVTGTFSDPQISLDMRESARATMEQVREQIRTRVEEEVEKRVEQVEDKVRDEASARAEQLLQEAEKRAEQVRKVAADAAEVIRKEGEANALRIEQEAEGRGFIAEAAAKRAAEAVRREAEQKADSIIREADERSEKLLEDARREAEKLGQE